MELGRISIAGESNIGAGRAKNEDNYCIFNPPGFPAALAVVCDGIGGHRDGEVASMFCCRRMMAAFLHRGEELHGGAEAGAFLAETLTDINAAIFRRNEFDGRTLPMGCTAVCAVFTADEFAYCSVGDSRIYDFAPETGALRQLSVDDVGADGRALSRAIGIRRRVEIAPCVMPLEKGRVHLLCSDGLHHFVDDAGIADSLREFVTPRVAVNRLMRRALLRGAGDNITIVVAWNKA
jgi:serine/threonine protein phosphatase PrpC